MDMLGQVVLSFVDRLCPLYGGTYDCHIEKCPLLADYVLLMSFAKFLQAGVALQLTVICEKSTAFQ